MRHINIRGSKFTVEDLTPIWLGLRDNISVCSLEYQRENVVFAFDILQCIESELILNQEICQTIFPRMNQSLEHRPTVLELNDAKIQNIQSVLKYTRHNHHLRSIDLSFTDLGGKDVARIVQDIASREIHHIQTLNLSRNITINDEVANMLRGLFRSNSAIKHLYLDDTSITHKGLADLIDSTTENLKLLTLSIKNSDIRIASEDQPEWKSIIQSMKQNCSLTTINLQHNIRVDEEFLIELDKELHRNEQIVEIIMPKIMA